MTSWWIVVATRINIKRKKKLTYNVYRTKVRNPWPEHFDRGDVPRYAGVPGSLTRARYQLVPCWPASACARGGRGVSVAREAVVGVAWVLRERLGFKSDARFNGIEDFEMRDGWWKYPHLRVLLDGWVCICMRGRWTLDISCIIHRSHA